MVLQRLSTGRATSIAYLKRALVALLFVFTALIGVARAADEPPTIQPYQTVQAPLVSIPNGNGGLTYYHAQFVSAGSFLIEIASYDSDAETASGVFTVRNPATHAAIYTLRGGAGFSGVADPIVFTDGKLLALRLRASPGAPATIALHDLATGAHLKNLVQPDSADAQFGHTVLFTADRVLVAAPGSDVVQPDAGALYVFDRISGAFVTQVSPGVAQSRFGAQVDDAPLPLWQAAGARAVAVHQNRAYVFSSDQLLPLAFSDEGADLLKITHAEIHADTVAIATQEQDWEDLNRTGRVIAFNATTGALRYQLRAAAMKGSYAFPSSIAIAGGRLLVHDAFATHPNASSEGALAAFDLVTGRRLAIIGFPKVADTYQYSMLATGDLAWVLTVNRTRGKRETRSWTAFDPRTLARKHTLATPSSRYELHAEPPIPAGNGRFGVRATRYRASAPIVGGGGGVVVIVISPIQPPTTDEVLLVYDTAEKIWLHGLHLPRNASGWLFTPPHPLPAVLPTAVANSYRLHETTSAVQLFATTLPSPRLTTELASRITYTTQHGYIHELLRKTASSTTYTPYLDIGLGDGSYVTRLLPYSDFSKGTLYRLDSSQYSARLSPSSPYSTASPDSLPKNDGGSVAVAGIYSAQGSSIISVSGTVIVGKHGNWSGYLRGELGFGAHLFLAEDRLVTSEVHTVETDGAYTHTARLVIIDLTTNERLLEIPYAVRISTSATEDLPPLSFKGSGNHVVFRAVATSEAESGATTFLVYDVTSGELACELLAPDPQPGDRFGEAFAVGGGKLAASLPETGEVLVYDLSSGAHLHTLFLTDKPETVDLGAVRLSISPDGARLAWFVEKDNERDANVTTGAVYLFDLETGLEKAKVIPDAPLIPWESPKIFTNAFLTDSDVLVGTDSGNLYKIGLDSTFVAAPLVQQSVLTPHPVVKFSFATRKGVYYVLQYRRDRRSPWVSLDGSRTGTGLTVETILSLPPKLPHPRLEFRVRTSWGYLTDDTITVVAPGADL